MHIFRWLMTHPIVTAWILAALAILLNLNMGTKGDHDKVGHEAGHDKKEVHEVVESEAHAKTEVQTDVTDKEADKDSQSVSLEAGQQVKGGSSKGNSATSSSATSSSATSNSASSENIAVSTTEASEKADESQRSSITGQAVATAIAATVPAVSKPNSADAPSADKQEVGAEEGENKAGNGGQISTEGLASMKTEQLIQLAREAFWQGDKEKSVAIYQALIEREPASLSHKGELANVYWHQEKQKESAALYAEIAVPMVKEGKTKEVANMLGFIGVFFPEKAAELQGLISQ